MLWKAAVSLDGFHISLHVGSSSRLSCRCVSLSVKEGCRSLLARCFSGAGVTWTVGMRKKKITIGLVTGIGITGSSTTWLWSLPFVSRVSHEPKSSDDEPGVGNETVGSCFMRSLAIASRHWCSIAVLLNHRTTLLYWAIYLPRHMWSLWHRRGSRYHFFERVPSDECIYLPMQWHVELYLDVSSSS